MLRPLARLLPTRRLPARLLPVRSLPVRLLPLVLAAALAPVVLAPAVHAQDGTLPVRATDLYEMRSVGNVAVSPDGRHVLYTVTQPWRDADTPGAKSGYRTHLWLAPTDGSRPPRALTSGAASIGQATWHPASDRIAFVRTTGEGAQARPQVFVLPLDGGEAYAVTRPDDRASSPAFSPDGRRLLVALSKTEADLRREGRHAAPAWLAERDGPDGQPRLRPADSVAARPDGSLDQIRAYLDRNADEASPRVYRRLNYLDESGLAGPMSFRHLAVVDVPAPGDLLPAPRALTFGYRNAGAAAWLGNGAVLFASTDDSTRHPDEERTNALYRLDLATGARRVFVARPGTAFGAPVVAGSTVAFTLTDTDDPYFQSVVAVVDTAGRNLRTLTAALDRSAGGVRLSKDGRTAFFTTNTEGGVPIYRVAVDGRVAPVRLTPLTHGVQGFDVAGAQAFVALHAVDRVSDLARVSATNETAPVYVSDHNGWLRSRRVVRPTMGWLARPGGLRVQYWTMPPAQVDAARRHPIVLQMHGGPSAMWGPGVESMWHELQFYAARGYAVVYANPRGSGGYGRTFQRANHQDWGDGPASDVLAATDAALAAMPFADPARQVVTGGSYAGYLTAWIVAHTDRFKAAAAQRGVYDLPTFFGEGNAWRLVPNAFGGYPWQDSTVVRATQGDTLSILDLLREQSPLSYVQNIRTPLLIKHGDADRRTGFVQSEMLFRSLVQLGRDVEYARYPGATHELSRSGVPAQRLDRLLRLYEFMARYVE